MLANIRLPMTSAVLARFPEQLCCTELLCHCLGKALVVVCWTYIQRDTDLVARPHSPCSG
jgi:hypothetical protein